jgi:hypothetical protein
VVSEKPFRVTVDVNIERGEALAVTLDRSGSVVSTDRFTTP